MNLKRAHNIAALRLLAKKRLPRMVFDYIDGGADDEVTLRQNVERFREIPLLWDALVDISAIDTTGSVFGRKTRLPFFISPTASSRLFNPRGGERAVARAATKAGIAYSMSTLGSTAIEDIAEAAPGPKLFQIYVWKDRGLVREILQRVRAAGFSGIVLTVDVPVAGNRERDFANDFTIPPKVTVRTAMQALARPGYMLDLALTPKITAANFDHLNLDMGVIDFITTQFDRSVTWRDAEWLQEAWNGPMAIKGVATPADAARCAAMNAKIWVSNHGGRQLDTSPATIDLLPTIADAVAGKSEIIFDGGIRRGGDIVKALALGANSVAIGRAYLYGLAAAGEAGVTRALEILESEFVRTMALIGRTCVADLGRDVLGDVSKVEAARPNTMSRIGAKRP
ncbi:MAG: alpha-hydroxy acid oxidase [Pseudomonadota bacterium]